jgi:solute carrier family 35 protein E1
MAAAPLDTGITKFPAFAPPDTLSSSTYSDSEARNRSPDARLSTSSPERNPLNLQLRPSLDSERLPAYWQARRSSRAGPSHSRGFSRGRHGRQRSLSEAIQVIRERKGSMSQNAQEIADALRAPVSPRLVVSIHNILCPQSGL